MTPQSLLEPAAENQRLAEPLNHPPRKKPQRVKKPGISVHTTTLWDYPSQSHGHRDFGDKNYIGVTPSHVIWNLIQRYTSGKKSLVVDPFCGSGTTLDVARELGRKALGYDIHPTREGVFKADARRLPVEDGKVDLWFADPPYSTHIDYSDAPGCLGKIHAGSPVWRTAFGTVFAEAHRVLKPGGIAAVYISDSFEKSGENKGFYPLGMWCWQLLAERFEPVDWVAVKRYHKTLDMGNYHKAAEEENFYLRGFNHLLIFRKPVVAIEKKPRHTRKKPRKHEGAKKRTK